MKSHHRQPQATEPMLKVSVTLHARQVRHLRRLAVAEGEPLSRYVRQAIEHFIANPALFLTGTTASQDSDAQGVAR